MRDARNGVVAILVLGFVACSGSPGTESENSADIIGSSLALDIVGDSFPEAQAAIRAEVLALSDIGASLDFDALRAAHLQSPKFSDFGDGLERHDFEQMIAAEIAAVSALKELSIDFRDLRIDVFGDVAIATSFPRYTWTNEDGERDGLNRRATMVYVKTADGWKIAHEHLSAPGSE